MIHIETLHLLWKLRRMQRQRYQLETRLKNHVAALERCRKDLLTADMAEKSHKEEEWWPVEPDDPHEKANMKQLWDAYEAQWN